MVVTKPTAQLHESKQCSENNVNLRVNPPAQRAHVGVGTLGTSEKNGFQNDSNL